MLVLTNKDMEDKIEPRLVADGPHGLELKGREARRVLEELEARNLVTREEPDVI